eukprot:5891612-Lingulodinium_polyedra.AAC.1
MPQANDAPRCLVPASSATQSLLLDSMHLAEPLDKRLQCLDLLLELLAHPVDSFVEQRQALQLCARLAVDCCSY